MKNCFVWRTTTSHCVNQLSENFLWGSKAFCGAGAYNCRERFKSLSRAVPFVAPRSVSTQRWIFLVSFDDDWFCNFFPFPAVCKKFTPADVCFVRERASEKLLKRLEECADARKKWKKGFRICGRPREIYYPLPAWARERKGLKVHESYGLIEIDLFIYRTVEWGAR